MEGCPKSRPMKPAVAVAFAAISVLALLAGCATPDDSGPAAAVRDPAWAQAAVFGHGVDPAANGHIPDHDHRNRTLHTGLSTPNFELVGHTALNSTYFGKPSGSEFCGDVAAPAPAGRQLAVVDSHATDVALTVLDVTDRARPQVLGELVLPYVQTYDSAIFADGSYAVVAANPDWRNDQGFPGVANGAPLTPFWRTACGTRAMGSSVDAIPYGYSALLIDLTDPANPVVADFFPYAGGRNVHSISTAIVDGVRWVATSGLGAIPCTPSSFVPPSPVPPPEPVPGVPSVPCVQQVPRYGNLLSHFDFFTVDESPAGAQLNAYALYTPQDQTHLDPSLLYLGNGHTDATVEQHPNSNRTIAYLADWDGGLHIVYLEPADSRLPAGLPGKATPVASWGAAPGDDPTQNTGNIHTVRPVPGLRNGHHYLITGQEVVGRPAGRPSGQIVILDVTDASHPIPVARWTLPVEVMWPSSLGLTFSTHYSVLVEDTLYVAAYHSGVWAVDASMDNWPDLPSLGVFVPDIAPAEEPVSGDNTPSVLEVLDLGDGNVMLYDSTSGAYIVRFHPEDTTVPPALPWPETSYIG